MATSMQEPYAFDDAVDDKDTMTQDERNRERYFIERRKQIAYIRSLITDSSSPGARAAQQCFNNAKVLMVGALKSYQNEGVEYMLVHEHMVAELGNAVPGGINADSVGLGKTYMAARLALGDVRPDKVRIGVTPVVKKTLIITPNSMTMEWGEQLCKFMRKADDAPNETALANMGFANAKAVVNNIRGQQMKFIGGRGYVLEMDKTNKCLLQVPDMVGIVVCSITMLTQSRKSDKTAKYTDDYGVPKFIIDTHWHRLIVDEGHMGRNANTETHKTLLRIKATNKWLLTATPVHNKVSELTALAGLIGVPPGVVSTQQIRDSYMLQRIQKYEDDLLMDMNCVVEDVQLSKYEAELYVKVQQKLAEAPKTQRMSLYAFLRECATDHRVYLAGVLERDMTQAKEAGTYESRDVIIAQIMKDHDLAAIAGIDEDEALAHPARAWDAIMLRSSTKMRRLVTHLEKIRASNLKKDNPEAREKSIVFCEYITEVKCLCAALKDSHIMFEKITGADDKITRFASIKSFEMRSDCVDLDTDVLIIQSSCGSEGLNLQCANHVFFMSPTWNPGREVQGIGRCFRTGQDKCVKVVRFMAHMVLDDGTRMECMDQHCMIVQDRKKTLVKTLLQDDSAERCLGKIQLSDDEIKTIISGVHRNSNRAAATKRPKAQKTDSRKKPRGPCAMSHMQMTLVSDDAGFACSCVSCVKLGGVTAVIRGCS